jgi:hypothetical protein
MRLTSARKALDSLLPLDHLYHVVSTVLTVAWRTLVARLAAVSQLSLLVGQVLPSVT